MIIALCNIIHKLPLPTGTGAQSVLPSLLHTVITFQPPQLFSIIIIYSFPPTHTALPFSLKGHTDSFKHLFHKVNESYFSSLLNTSICL